MAQQPAKRLISLFMVILLFGAAACAPTITDYYPLNETPHAEPDSATPTPEILADCFPGADVLAWLDENGNGLQDEGEPPLAGIQFYLSPTAQFSYGTTGEDGVAHISAWAPGECLAMQITAVTFAGYTLTTPQKVDYLSADTDYRFGFQPLLAAAHIETEAYSGAIFTAASTAEFITWLDEPADDFWTPTEADVTNFETGLVAFLAESSDMYRDTAPIIERLPEYTRQYFGIVQNDEQLIFVNMFCDAMGSDWLETAVVVADGGNCYLQIIFNANDNTFLSIHINGES